MQHAPGVVHTNNDSHSSEDSGPEILTLEDGDPPEIRERPLQDRKPKVNDLISYYNDRLHTWVDAKIIRDLTRQWKDYYNIEYSNGEKDGLYLKKETRWTFLTDSSGNLLTQGNVRSGSAPPSLHPTPDTSPTREPSPSLGSNNRLSDLAPIEDGLSDSSSLLSSTGTMDLARTQSMEWDMSYCDLESSLQPINHPIDHVVLDQVNNLESVLPVSSTPVPHKPRLSRMRRPLPLEQHPDNDHIPGFVRRMLPFKQWLR